MASKIITDIRRTLNEEKWTRATVSDHGIANFKQLDKLIQELDTAALIEECKDICEEQLKQSKQSIGALYIGGTLRISSQAVDDSYLLQLIKIFTDTNKWNVAIYLAEHILAYGENKETLRLLAECYINSNQQEHVPNVWRRLIKVDFEEADIVYQLAQMEEEAHDIPKAIEFYKKALHRYTYHKNFEKIKLIWKKLINLKYTDTEFYFRFNEKIGKQLSHDQAGVLFDELYPLYYNKKDWKTTIKILKNILNYNQKNRKAREQILECYSELYKNHSHLQEFIRISNLSQSWRNVHEAIADFEKHISFDVGNFAFHRTWGVGKLMAIDGDSVTLHFPSKPTHTMSLKLAVDALIILPRDHIWTLRSLTSKQKLHDLVKKNIIKTIKIIIQSFNNCASMKRIKNELCPHILSPEEWSTWGAKARTILKTNPEFGNLPDKSECFEVRDRPISFDEKSRIKFQSERNFFKRVKQVIELDEFYKGERENVDADVLRNMINYFLDILRSQTLIDEIYITSWLLVDRISKNYPYLAPNFNDLEIDFLRLMEALDTLPQLFDAINNSILQHDLLRIIHQKDKQWARYYLLFFPFILSKPILEELLHAKQESQVSKMAMNAIENYRDHRKLFIWLIRNCTDDEWFKKLNIEYDRILITLIQLLNITIQEAGNRKNVAENQKLTNYIKAYLFTENHLSDFIEIGNEDALNRIYTLLRNIKELDPSIAIELRRQIQARLPQFKFYGDEKREVVTHSGILVSQKSYEKKRQELQHIHDVEVPKNSKEIGSAIQRGDLSENAEYKAAKERQETLNSTVARLKKDLEQARIVHPKDVQLDKIRFGTRAKLFNLDTEKHEEFVILGPWESNPKNFIISYLSPLGNKLYNQPVGAVLDFKINNKQHRYRVDELSAEDF